MFDDFQITLQTAKFDKSDAMFAVISTLSITFWVAISFALLERRDNA
jgi:hypothetical protein